MTAWWTHYLTQSAEGLTQKVLQKGGQNNEGPEEADSNIGSKEDTEEWFRVVLGINELYR